MTDLAVWERVRETAKDLIEHWLTRVEVPVPVGLDAAKFVTSYAWAQHCHHVALQFIQTTDRSEWWHASGSLVRLCHELAVKAQWIARVDGAVESDIYNHEKQRHRLYKSYFSVLDKSNIDPHPEAARWRASIPSLERPELVVANFRRICQEFKDHDSIYLAYQVLCRYSHADLLVVNDYIDLQSDNSPRSCNPTPRGTPDPLREFFMNSIAQSLVWSQSAVISQLGVEKDEVRRIADMAIRAGCYPLPPLKQSS